MRFRCFAIIPSVLLLVTMSSASALPAAPVDNGMVFGGQWTPASNATAVTHNLSDLPAVAEVHTATWCDNCVDVEHALEDVHDAGHLQQYHIHSTFNDPFGTTELNERWRQKYEPNSPPGVVFNGSVKKVGSVPDDGDLVNEFTNLAQRDLALGEGTTMFSWTPTTDSSGTFGWALDLEQRHLENATLNVTAWIVETASDYEDGQNGLGTYPHIVRQIIGLGDASQGTATIQLPTPNDGNDLEVHLIYEVMPFVPELVEEEPVQESEDTPALSLFSTMMVVGLALALTQRDRQE